MLANYAKAQIDTTDWYPLHIGDKWEYYGQGFGNSQVEVIGDTLMPNGKTYYMFSEGVDAWRFQRKQSDNVYYYSTAAQKEYLLFDFKSNVTTLWKVDFEHYWGIFETNIDNQNLLNAELPYRIFERANIDSTTNPPDTIWGYLIDAYPTRITKGIGVTSYAYGLTHLVGAVINGIGYGTLVTVENDRDKNVPSTFNLYQNYPNPFNASTIIRYEISDSRYGSQNTNLSVYNALGQKITELVSQASKPGFYEVTLDGETLPSGTYFIQLTIGKNNKIIKAILLK